MSRPLTGRDAVVTMLVTVPLYEPDSRSWTMHHVMTDNDTAIVHARLTARTRDFEPGPTLRAVQSNAPTPGPATVAPLQAAPPAGNMLREFLDGLALLGRGIGMWARSPRLMLLGAVPALISFALLTTAFVLLAMYIHPVVGTLTPFAAASMKAYRSFWSAATPLKLCSVAARLIEMTVARWCFTT